MNMLSDETLGSLDKYLRDLKSFENSFFCNECGCSNMKEFVYLRTFSSGEVWMCKRCSNDIITGEAPNEDNY